MTDRELIEEILGNEEYRERAGSRAVDAFSAWGRQRDLSPKQAAWLHDVAERLGLQAAPSANLVSGGVVRPTSGERASLAEFHASLGPKALKPPGRPA